MTKDRTKLTKYRAEKLIEKSKSITHSIRDEELTAELRKEQLGSERYYSIVIELGRIYGWVEFEKEIKRLKATKDKRTDASKLQSVIENLEILNKEAQLLALKRGGIQAGRNKRVSANALRRTEIEYQGSSDFPHRDS